MRVCLYRLIVKCGACFAYTFTVLKVLLTFGLCVCWRMFLCLPETECSLVLIKSSLLYVG